MTGDGESLAARVDRYIKDRIDDQLSYYDRQATKMKSYYMTNRKVTAIVAVLIPVMGGLYLPLNILGQNFDLWRILITVAGLCVAILVSLEGVLHHREQWQNFRTTSEFIKAQKFLFFNRVDEYGGVSDEEAFKTLVMRVEAAIKNENEVTLNVLARVDSSSERSPG